MAHGTGQSPPRAARHGARGAPGPGSGGGASQPPQSPHLAFLLPHLRMGGVEKGLFSLIEPMRARGWRVSVILQRREGSLLERLAALTPPPPCLDLGGRRVPAASLALAGLLRRARFDLIYSATNATNIALLFAALMAGRRRAACVISEHTPLDAWIESHPLPRVRRALMRRLYPHARAFCAPTAEIGAELAALLRGRAPPLHVLPNAVVTEIPPWPPLAARANRLVSVGRLGPEKRFDLMIRAFARLHAGAPSARLTIHGEGPERPALEALGRELGLGGAVRLPGETADVAAVLARADGFLCTSAREGLGNALIEAQAAGVPVLSVDCPFGPRHLLRGGQAGLLVAGDDVDTLAAALARFHRDRAARQEWRDAARAIAQSYTVANAADAHDRLFRRIVRNHHGGAPT